MHFNKTFWPERTLPYYKFASFIFLPNLILKLNLILLRQVLCVSVGWFQTRRFNTFDLVNSFNPRLTKPFVKITTKALARIQPGINENAHCSCHKTDCPFYLRGAQIYLSFLFHCYTFIFFVSDDESGEKSVSVLLAGEESELTFIDFATADLSVSVPF